jgi:hypothetical protein
MAWEVFKKMGKQKRKKVNGRANTSKEALQMGMEKGEMAIRKLSVGRRMQIDASKHGFYDPVSDIDGKRLEKEGMELLKVGDVQGLAGNELVESDREDVSFIRETLRDPNSVSVGASLQRLRLLDEMHFLEMAVDASETIKAENSLEKMLTHQMTACHVMSMRLMLKATKYTRNLTTSYSHSDTEKAVKVVNAVARLMDTFQRGMATLAKIRTRGQQKVTVEHVHVNKGGQAIVGSVNQGGGGVEKRGIEGEKDE